MFRLELITCCAALALIAGCGEPSDTTASGTSTGDPGPTTGPTTEPTTEPTGATSTETTETTGDGLTCDMFGFQQTGPGVTITLRNQRATPVYVYNWVFCGRPVMPLEIVDLAAPDVPLNWWLDEKEDECTEFGCGCEGGAESTPDSVIKLGPGGSYSESWAGHLYTAIEAPAECVGDTVCAAACLLRQQAPDGTYRITASAGTEVVGGEGFDCEPDPQLGFCQLVDGFTPGGTTLAVTAELAYPGATAIELVFVD